MISRKSWWILICINLVMIVLMALSGSPLKNKATPDGIINLELAEDSAAVQNTLNVWSNDISQEKDLLNVARENTYLDFLFLACYTALFYFACKHLGNSFIKGSLAEKACNVMAVIAILTGLLDLVENGGMLLYLKSEVNRDVVRITHAASLAKWLLVALM
ncbi:MAG: hypothetical protein EOO04_39300, partial [Chitinophagaceae bacterium]